MDATPRLACLGCDRLLGPGEPVCLSCGEVPFARTHDGSHAVIAGPIASMAFRTQAAQLLADHIPGTDVDALKNALAGRAVVAQGVDPEVGRALVQRLKKIPAEAEVLPLADVKPTLASRLFGPLPLLLYGAGLVTALVTGMWMLAGLVGIGAGVAIGMLRPPKQMQPLSQPPLLPPPPKGARELIALSGKLEGEDRSAALEVVRGSIGLLAAAHRQGLPTSSARVDGMGAAVADVVVEALDVGQRSTDGDEAARQRLREIAQAVQKAVTDLGPKALPATAPEQRLLDEAEVVKEIADISGSS